MCIRDRSQTIRLEEKDYEIQQLRQRLQSQSSSNRDYQEARSKAEISNGIQLMWREEERSPSGMNRRFAADAVVDGTTVYVIWCSNYYTSQVRVYQTQSNAWSNLPDCPISCCPIEIINGLLTTIGGYSKSSKADNKLLSFTGDDQDRKWTEKYPPMPTCRHSSTALCTETYLIVAGGKDRDKVVMRKVEVMNTETHQWSTASDLPAPRLYSSITICDDILYMLGGACGAKHIPVRSVYICSLSALLQSCQPAHLTDRVSVVDQTSMWSRVEDLPVTSSTCVSLHGQLLAVGGIDSNDKPVTAVYMYNPTAAKWEVISHMYTPRSYCYAAVLSNNQLIVMGGMVESDLHCSFKGNSESNNTDSTECAVMK